MRPFFKVGIFCIVLAVTGGIALAQFAKPEDAIKYRKSVMQVIKKHFGSIAAVVKGQKPYDKGVVAEDASVIAVMSTLPWEASLVPGSAAGDTTLSEKALKDTKGFMAAAHKFEKASKDLAMAAESGDLGAVKAKFGATAQTCGGCHKPYRK
jgi:cytochrome c556